jgi:hypothetical protein
VDTALGVWADHGLGVPVPRPKDGVAGQDMVIYGLLFVTLLIMVWSLVDLGFALIEVFLPDPLRETGWANATIRWSVATLIVVLPIFVALNLRVERALRRDPGQKRAPLRRRIGALTLFLAALSLLGAAVSVVYAGLTGTISAQFLAKAALVVGLSGLVIAYFRDYVAEP